MDSLLKYIHFLTDFSEESWEKLQPALTKKKFHKNELLLQEGQVCDTLFYVEKGYCKSYYEIDGIIKNTGFFFENEIATNITSFGTGLKSEFNIIACEPLTVVLFDKQKLLQIARQNPEVDALGRNCLRLLATKQEEFVTLFKLYAAKERLRYVEINYPLMLQRIPLTQLASFLGVTRETLSRIRKRSLEM